jgi:hypothetical protein
MVEPAQVRLAMSHWDRDSFSPAVGQQVEVKRCGPCSCIHVCIECMQVVISTLASPLPLPPCFLILGGCRPYFVHVSSRAGLDTCLRSGTLRMVGCHSALDTARLLFDPLHGIRR